MCKEDAYPPLPTALGLSQLLSLGTASNIQLAHLGISLVPRLSNVRPLNLCSWIITMFLLGVKELIKLISFAILAGSFRPQILCEIMFYFIDMNLV